ncbi:MAG: proton-conducting transporter membrane subunit, partial [Saezia sp.]
MGLGLFGLFYGAWLAFGQTNIKRLIAYTSVSHMGLVTIAIYSGSLLAYQGAVVQMVAHGISAAGLFVVCGILYSRLKTLDMREMGGLWGQIRYLPAFSLLFAVATLGMPGTGNFVGEFLMFFGAFKAAPVVIIIAAFGMVFAAIYALTLVQRVYFGSTTREEPLQRLCRREFMLLLVLALILVFIGLYPQVLLHTAQGSTVLIGEWFNSFVPHINSIAGR